MKKIKIILILLFVVSISAPTFALNYNNADLVQRMYNDKDVKQLTINTTKITLISSLVPDISKLSNNNSLKISNLEIENKHLVKVIENKFVEFKLLTNNQKEQLLTTLISRTAVYQDWLLCIGFYTDNSLLIPSGVTSTANTTAYKRTRFLTCFATAVVKDLVDRFNAGSTTNLPKASIKQEVSDCYLWVYEVSINAKITTASIDTFIYDILNFCDGDR